VLCGGGEIAPGSAAPAQVGIAPNSGLVSTVTATRRRRSLTTTALTPMETEPSDADIEVAGRLYAEWDNGLETSKSAIERRVGAENSSGPLTCGFTRAAVTTRWISGTARST
jgi:hypothetical protein